jgi:hypothetical protein
MTHSDDNSSSRSNTWPKIGALLGNGTDDGGTLDFTFGVDNDAGVVCGTFEIGATGKT